MMPFSVSFANSKMYMEKPLLVNDIYTASKVKHHPNIFSLMVST